MAIKENKEEVSQERLKKENSEDDKDGDENSYNRYMYTKHRYLVYSSRQTMIFFIILSFFTNFCLYSRFLVYTGYIVIKQLCIFTQENTVRLQRVNLTYNRVLSAIEKVLKKLVKEYYSIDKFF